MVRPLRTRVCATLLKTALVVSAVATISIIAPGSAAAGTPPVPGCSVGDIAAAKGALQAADNAVANALKAPAEIAVRKQHIARERQMLARAERELQEMQALLKMSPKNKKYQEQVRLRTNGAEIMRRPIDTWEKDVVTLSNAMPVATAARAAAQERLTLLTARCSAVTTTASTTTPRSPRSVPKRNGG